MNIHCREISADEFATGLQNAQPADVEALTSAYRREFKVDDNIDDATLHKTAQGEATLRSLMETHHSHACGINFQTLCNHPQIGDALHVAASRLMAQGLGYAGEGDWVTASFVYALQQGARCAGFSEMFTVDYVHQRLLLRHWGEANLAMARTQPDLMTSNLRDTRQSQFLVVGFEYHPGPATLLNLNSTPDQDGQIITIVGQIAQEPLDRSLGPRALFEPARTDVGTLLDDYAYAGGSHHLVLVPGDVRSMIDKVARLTGWKHIKLSGSIMTNPKNKTSQAKRLHLIQENLAHKGEVFVDCPR